MNRPVREPLETKVFARITREPNGCWLWTGGVDRDGQPVISHGVGNQVRPARAAWELVHKKPLASDIRLKRTCGAKLCINPEHARSTKVPGRNRKAA